MNFVLCKITVFKLLRDLISFPNDRVIGKNGSLSVLLACSYFAVIYFGCVSCPSIILLLWLANRPL